MNNIQFILCSIWIFAKEGIYYLLSKPKAECFIDIVTQLGNINIFYIKLFQTLSTNTHILTQEQIIYLSSYTDNVPYCKEELDYSFIQTTKQVSKELKHSLEIDTTDGEIIPYRSGMIAVVYTGKINNERIIIKVIRKNVLNKLTDALENMNFLVNILSYIPYINILNIRDIVQENKELLLSQTNFNLEVSNIKQMSKNCKNTDYIVIPDVYEEYTQENNNMIVMKLIEGITLEEISDIDKDEYSLLIAKFGIKCLLFNRFYHGDLHSGNILFIKEGGNYKLGILDFGICGKITREEQEIFYNLFTLIGKSVDYMDVSKYFINNFVDPKDSIENLNKIYKIQLIIKIAHLCKLAFSEAGFGALDLYEISKLLNKYDLYLNRKFCRIEVALAVADSVSSQLYYESSYMINVKKIVGELNSIIEY